MNLAYYTYFFGSNDNIAFIIPDIPSLTYDCYYYTNNKDMYEKLKETPWKRVYIDKEFKNDDQFGPNMFGNTLRRVLTNTRN